MAEWLGARLHIRRPVDSVPYTCRWAFYTVQVPGLNVFLLLFIRLNVFLLLFTDSFCCSVVSVEQEQQENGRTFTCSTLHMCIDLHCVFCVLQLVMGINPSS